MREQTIDNFVGNAIRYSPDGSRVVVAASIVDRRPLGRDVSGDDRADVSMEAANADGGGSGEFLSHPNVATAPRSFCDVLEVPPRTRALGVRTLITC